MNEIGDYIEKKLLIDYIQNVVKVDDMETDDMTDGIFYWGGLDRSSASSIKSNSYNIQSLENSPFLSSFIDEDKIELPENLQRKAKNISTELRIPQAIQDDIEKLLLKIYTSNTEKEIRVSRSGENEFLIYIEVDGTYKNVLINEDGDVEVLIIPPNRSKSFNKTFYKEIGFSYSKVVNSFNEV